MDRIRATFQQKLGPLPVWAWAAIVLVALLGYWYFSKSGPFSSGGSAGTGAGDQSGSGTNAGSLFGNLGQIVNPAAAASTGLAGGGGNPVVTIPYVGQGSGGSSSAPATGPMPIYAAVTPGVAIGTGTGGFVSSGGGSAATSGGGGGSGFSSFWAPSSQVIEAVRQLVSGSGYKGAIASVPVPSFFPAATVSHGVTPGHM